MKHKYLQVSIILEYISAFIYALITALFFSVSEKIYWLFLVLGLLSLCLGLYSESIKNRLEKENKLNKVDFITLIVITVISVIDCLPLLFNIFALVTNKESKSKLVYNENYQEKEVKEKKWFLKPCFIVSVIALLGIIGSSISGNLFETTGGTVSVQDGTLTKKETDLYNKGQPLNGTSYTIEDPAVKVAYTVYKPKQASASNPLPVTFVVPGFTRTKATMAQYAIELSRRGSVVFTIDPGSQGATTHGGYQYDETTGEYVLDENGKKIQNSYSVAGSSIV